jgi:ligand-binding SRPBCC domain-containing protein
MPVIELTTFIDAPIQRVFDLSRSIDLHLHSASHTGERAIAGITSGLIGADQEVTWRARHFGIWQSLTVKITAFHPPTHFTDTMLRGAFKRMKHEHFFEPYETGTKMRDVFEFEAPFGIFGRIAEALVLSNYMRNFLVQRNQEIKAIAESDEWKLFLEITP